MSWKQTPVKKVVNDFNRTPWWGGIERGRALATGAWRRSRWMTGSWVVGSGGRGASILEDSWGWEKPWKKATPSGTEVGALVWKRSSGWCLTLSLLFFGNTAAMVVVVGALTAVGAGRSNNSADLGIESFRWTERQGSRQGRCGQKDKAGMRSAHF